MTEFIGGMGAKELVSGLKVEAETLTGPTAKFFSPSAAQRLRERFDARPGDLILIVADTQAVSSLALSSLRARLAAELSLYDPKPFHYSWIVPVPAVRLGDAEEGRFAAEHHLFTMPPVRGLARCSIPTRPQCAPRLMIS